MIVDKLYVVAGGAASSLSDLRNGCAAVRAGMVRQSENVQVKNFEPDTGDIIPATTHPVWNDLLAGYGVEARLFRLLELAFKDLQNSIESDVDWENTGVVINFSSDYYQQVYDGEFYEGAEEHTALVQRVLKRFARGIGVDESRAVAVLGDGAGIYDAFEQVGALLGGDVGVERCLVGAVESMLAFKTLDQLLEMGLISTPSDCSGFYPGEAAALFVVDKAISSEGSIVSVGRFVQGQGVADFDDDPVAGVQLAKVIEEAVGSEEEPIHFALGGNNGSAARSYESSVALVATELVDQEAEVWHMAESFGETGAVSGFLSVAVLIEAFGRGYAPVDRALVWQGAPNGRRVAFVVEKGGASLKPSGHRETAFNGLDVLYEEHLEEASFLYVQRNTAILEDSVPWGSMGEYSSQRLEAHLDALVIGGELALELCKRQAFEGDAGELYAAVSVFSRQGRRDLLDAVLEDFDWGDEDRVQALVDALCLEAPEDWCASLVDGWLIGEVAQMCAACRLVGFRRLGLVEQVEKLFEHEKTAVKDSAMWALAQCGAKEEWAAFDCPLILQALCGDLIIAEPESEESIHALGIHGLSETIPKLIDVLANEALAESAALSLNLITGAGLQEEVFIPEDMQEEDLFPEELEAFRAGSLYQEGEWPGETVTHLSQCADIWQAWWNENKEQFAGEGRYRNGVPFSKSALLSLLNAEDTPNQVRRWVGYELDLQFDAEVPFDVMMRVQDQKNAIEMMG